LKTFKPYMTILRIVGGGLLVRTVKGKEVKRKTFVARADLIDQLGKVAETKGYSLYALVNEIFELVLKAEELGLDLRRIFEERGVLEKAKSAGFILGLESLWYSMTDLVYEKAKNRVLKEWAEAGLWLAKRYATSCSTDPIEDLKRDLRAFIWNASQFIIEVEGEGISVRILSPRFSEGYSFLLAALLEGLLNGLGFEVVEREVFRGNIRLEGIRNRR